MSYGDLYNYTDNDIIGKTVRVESEGREIEAEVKWVGRNVVGRRYVVLQDDDGEVEVVDLYYCEWGDE